MHGVTCILSVDSLSVRHFVCSTLCLHTISTFRLNSYKTLNDFHSLQNCKYNPISADSKRIRSLISQCGVFWTIYISIDKAFLYGVHTFFSLTRMDQLYQHSYSRSIEKFEYIHLKFEIFNLVTVIAVAAPKRTRQRTCTA